MNCETVQIIGLLVIVQSVSNTSSLTGVIFYTMYSSVLSPPTQ